MHPTTIIRQQLIQSLVSLICASDLVEAVVVHGVYVDDVLGIRAHLKMIQQTCETTAGSVLTHVSSTRPRHSMRTSFVYASVRADFVWWPGTARPYCAERGRLAIDSAVVKTKQSSTVA